MDENLAINLISALAAVIAAGYAAVTVRAMNRQMRQLTDQQFTQLSNQHNWNLYDHRGELPPAIPAWRGLSDKGWAWRTLHLNHLNLLWLAYKDYKRGFMDSDELQGWARKAKYWFSDLSAESPVDDNKEGRETLRQLLEHKEGYSADFREWLRDNEIVPPDILK